MILNEDVPRRLSAWTALPIAALSLTILSGVTFAQERTTKLRKKKSTQSSQRSHADALRKKILKQVNDQLRKSLGKEYQVDGLGGVERAVNRYVRDQMRTAHGKADGKADGDATEKRVLRVTRSKKNGPHEVRDDRHFRLRISDADDIKILDRSQGAKNRQLDGGAIELLLERIDADAEDTDVESLIERIHKARVKKKSDDDQNQNRRAHAHFLELLHGDEDHDVEVLRTDGAVKAILKRLHGGKGNDQNKHSRVIRLHKGQDGAGLRLDVDVDIDVKVDGEGKQTKVIRRRVDDKDVEVHVRAHRMDGAKQRAGDTPKGAQSLIEILKDGKKLKNARIHVLGGKDGKVLHLRDLGGKGARILLHDVNLELEGLGKQIRGHLHDALERADVKVDNKVDNKADKKVILELIDGELREHLKAHGEQKDAKDRDHHRGERRERRGEVKKKINKIV